MLNDERSAAFGRAGEWNHEGHEEHEEEEAAEDAGAVLLGFERIRTALLM